MWPIIIYCINNNARKEELMREIILTCPFTGCEFSALIDADDNLYVNHPLTGEVNRINYNCSIKKYNISKQLFKHYSTVSLSEAAEILNVSRQRISAIALDGVIKPRTINGQTVFLLDEVLEYKENRKVGAPPKVK